MRRLQSAAPSAVVACALLLAVASVATAEVAANAVELRQRLRQEISCDFDDMPLGEVVQYFRDMLEINIVYDPPRDMYAEHMVTLSLRDVPAYSALRWALKGSGMDYGIEGNILCVSAGAETARLGPMLRRQYYVRDLMAMEAEFRNRGGNNNDNGGNNNDSDRDGGGNKNGGNNNDDDRDRAGDSLLRLIVRLTGRDNWDHVGRIGSTRDRDDVDRDNETMLLLEDRY